MHIPPMPNPKDFKDDNGAFRQVAYEAALKAWERVAQHCIESEKSNEFWNGARV